MRKYLSFTPWSLVVFALGGCGAEPGANQSRLENPPAATENWSETLSLGSDLKVTLSANTDGSGGLIATGPPETQAKFRSTISGVSSGAELYRRLKPGAKVPAALAHVTIPKDVVAVTPLEPTKALSPEDALTEPVKGAPVTQSAWSNYWCKDWINENQIAGNFYPSYDFCLENRTSNLSYDYYGVREAFFVAQMVAGTGTYKVFDRPNGSSAWTAQVNTTVQPGYFYASQRWGGSNLIDVRFQLQDVTGDTFNWAMQSARTPMSSMPATQANGGGNGEYVHFHCLFDDTWEYLDVWFEACLPSPWTGNNPGQEPTASTAGNRCDLIAQQYGVHSDGLLSIERMTSTHATMCNSNTLAYTNCGQSACTCNGMCPGWSPG